MSILTKRHARTNAPDGPPAVVQASVLPARLGDGWVRGLSDAERARVHAAEWAVSGELGHVTPYEPRVVAARQRAGRAELARVLGERGTAR